MNNNEDDGHPSNIQDPNKVVPPENTTNIIETTNPQEPTKSMEVHHHSHHEGKKNWKSYFWEFMMLFLAVFCGFLAEYQLEHMIEKERAKELSKNFYEELLNDSITAGVKVQSRLRQEQALEYLIKFFKDSSFTNASKSFAINFEYGISFRTPTLFEPRTIILDQLRNSGSLRYFKNDEFQKLTGDLTVAIKNIADRQDLESQNRLQYINPILMHHYDYTFDAEMKKLNGNVFDGVSEYAKSDRQIPYHINNIDKIDRQNIVDILSFYNGNVVNSTRLIHIQRYIDINAELLRVLRQEYQVH